MSDQLAFAFDAPSPPAPANAPAQVDLSVTPIAERLIAEGFVTDYCLQLNRGIDCGAGPSPSRAYRWPFHYRPPSLILGPERFVCASREFVTTPIAKRVLALFEDVVEFIDNEFTIRRRWHHAIDLMSEPHVGLLLETRHLTTDRQIAGAVAVELWGSEKRIGLKTGRRVLEEIRIPEPEDRSASAFASPAYPHIAATSTEGPVVNLPLDAVGGWCAVHGLEDGWLVRPRSGFLAPTPKLLAARGLVH